MKYKPGEKFVVEIKEGHDMRMPMYKLEQIGALIPECGLDKLPQLVSGVEQYSYNKGMEDAWELLNKYKEMDYDEREECFGNSAPKGLYNLINQYSPVTIQMLLTAWENRPTLTAREKHFVEFAKTGWMARNEDGELCWTTLKPYKLEHDECWGGGFKAYPIPRGQVQFPFITWEDEEPWSVEELRKLGVRDE